MNFGYVTVNGVNSNPERSHNGINRKRRLPVRYQRDNIQTGKPKPGGYPLLRRDKKHPPDERKEGDTMVTYSDLIQFSIFIVALVGLCYEIFKGKRK